MAEPAAAPPFPEAPSTDMTHPAPDTASGDVRGGTTGMVGGDRHYSGAGIGPLLAWKCPACGGENSGPLALGCSSCKSGSAAPQHVGVPPPPKGRGQARIGSGVWAGETPVAPSVDDPVPTDDVEAAFLAWLTPAKTEFSPRMQQVLFDAWRAAIQWYETRRRIEPAPDAPEEAQDALLIPRALLQQVVLTLQATFDLPDEQQSPELLDLISQLREIFE